MRMFAGGLDLPRPDSRRVRAWAEDPGVADGLRLCEGMPHVWTSASIPEGAEYRVKIADALALGEQEWGAGAGEGAPPPA